MKRGFLFSSGLSVFGSSLSSLCFITLVAKTEEPLLVTCLVGASFFAQSLSGALTGYLSRYFEVRKLLYNLDIVRIVLLLSFIYFYQESAYLAIGLNFFLSAIDGVFHANRLQYINLYFSDQKEKSLFISHLQGVDTTASMLGPVLAGLLIISLPMKICFLIDAFSYILTSLFWVLQKNVTSKSFGKFRILEGYYTIIENKSLKNMLLARMIGAIPMIIWSVLLPLILVNNLGKDLFSRNQGVVLSIMSLGVFATNFLLPKIKASKMKMIEKKLSLFCHISFIRRFLYYG